MWGLIESTVRAAASVVSVPVALAADAVTMGGALTDRDRPYTAEACSDLLKNVKGMTKPKVD